MNELSLPDEESQIIEVRKSSNLSHDSLCMEELEFKHNDQIDIRDEIDELELE